MHNMVATEMQQYDLTLHCAVGAVPLAQHTRERTHRRNQQARQRRQRRRQTILPRAVLLSRRSATRTTARLNAHAVPFTPFLGNFHRREIKPTMSADSLTTPSTPTRPQQQCSPPTGCSHSGSPTPQMLLHMLQGKRFLEMAVFVDTLSKHQMDQAVEYCKSSLFHRRFRYTDQRISRRLDPTIDNPTEKEFLHMVQQAQTRVPIVVDLPLVMPMLTDLQQPLPTLSGLLRCLRATGKEHLTIQKAKCMYQLQHGWAVGYSEFINMLKMLHNKKHIHMPPGDGLIQVLSVADVAVSASRTTACPSSGPG